MNSKIKLIQKILNECEINLDEINKNPVRAYEKITLDYAQWERMFYKCLAFSEIATLIYCRKRKEIEKGDKK